MNLPQTHTTTKPNTGNKPKKFNDVPALRAAMDLEFSNTVQNYYNGSKEEMMRFKTAAIDYVRKNPKLLNCQPISLLSAFVQVAQFRFLPSGVNGEAYIIPYGEEAKFQLGYQGLITLLYRSNKISTITSNIIYKNDFFEYEEGLNPKLIHKPAMFGTEKGEPIGVYTVVTMKDFSKTFKVMDKQSVMEIKNLSKAKNTDSSPWNSKLDPFLWMWKKTCLIQHSKLLSKTPELQEAIEKDFEGEGIEKPRLDAGGAGTGTANHKSTDGIDEEPPEDATVDIENPDGSVKNPKI